MVDGVCTKPIDDVVVRQPDYFKTMATLLDSIPLADWKIWLKWQVLLDAAPLLSRAVCPGELRVLRQDADGDTRNTSALEAGVAAVERTMGEAAGKIYVAKHFPPEAKAQMKTLVGNLIAAYREDIAHLDWMSPVTRETALEKLSKFTPKIGYPDKWRDYHALEIRRDDLVGNKRRTAAFETAYRLNKLGKPVDRDEWGMTPQTVNAYYNPSMNEIVFPAAILQPPFFDMQRRRRRQLWSDRRDHRPRDRPWLRRPGLEIRRERKHGQLVERLPTAASLINERRCLSTNIAPFEPAQLPGQKVNGALTIGENIGDLGGLAIAQSLSAVVGRPECPRD